jgi:molybdenum cofactor guanylyltransferase
MGANKALLRGRLGGPTLIEVVAGRLREAGLGPALVVTNAPGEYGFLGLEMVPDEVPGAGPLGGILTGLVHSPLERVFMVGCDMPLLSPGLIKYMVSLRDQVDVIIPAWTDSAGREQLETLHAVYSRGCIEPVRRRIGEGRFKVADLLEDVTVRYVREEELHRFDPDLSSFRNVNTPEEWAEFSKNTRVQSPGSETR